MNKKSNAFSMKGIAGGKSRYVNCTGFALNVNEYLQPEDFGAVWSNTRSIAEATPKHFNVELIGIMDAEQARKACKGGDFVLFRYGTEDYHWVTYTHRGQGFHKRGTAKYEKLTTDEVFANTWYNKSNRGGIITYDSRFVVFKWVGERGWK